MDELQAAPPETDATELRTFLWALVHGPAALRIAQGETGTYYDGIVTDALDVAFDAARKGRIPRVLTTTLTMAAARTRSRTGAGRTSPRTYRAGSPNA